MLGPVVGQRVESHPRVGHSAPVLVAVEGHLLRFVRFDQEGQPAVVLAVELDEPVGAAGRQRARLAPPPVVENPALGVDAPLLQQPLPPVSQQPVGALGVPPALAGGGGERAQPFGLVVAAPQDQPVERLVHTVLVREPLELVVLDRVGGVGEQPAVADEDHGGDHAADLRSEVQASLRQVQLEPVHPEAGVANVSGVRDLRFPQRLIPRRRARPVVVRVVLRAPGGRPRREGDEGRDRQYRCGGPQPVRHEASLPPAAGGVAPTAPGMGQSDWTRSAMRGGEEDGGECTRRFEGAQP